MRRSSINFASAICARTHQGRVVNCVKVTQKAWGARIEKKESIGSLLFKCLGGRDTGIALRVRRECPVLNGKLSVIVVRNL
jgi:hypothetical protein